MDTIITKPISLLPEDLHPKFHEYITNARYDAARRLLKSYDILPKACESFCTNASLRFNHKIWVKFGELKLNNN